MNSSEVQELLQRTEAILDKINALEGRIINLEAMFLGDHLPRPYKKEWLRVKDAAILFNRSSKRIYAMLSKSDEYWESQNKFPLLRGAFWRKHGTTEINQWLFDIWLTSEGEVKNCSLAVKRWMKARAKVPDF